jgi:hypothetical protein
MAGLKSLNSRQLLPFRFTADEISAKTGAMHDEQKDTERVA